MTADQWNAAINPTSMLEFPQNGIGRARLRKMVSQPACERKLRLFATACCRRLWPSLADERSRRAVEVNEQFCDGEASLQELRDSHNDALSAYIDALSAVRGVTDAWRYLAAYPPTEASRSEYGTGFELCESLSEFAALASATPRAAALGQDEYDEPVWAAERTVQAFMIRDIFGNPFSPPAVDPAWLTSTVLALARGIYDGKAFDRLPVLADALADAGCDNDDLLSHCRGDGPHVRGCWAVDLILGKV